MCLEPGSAVVEGIGSLGMPDGDCGPNMGEAGETVEGIAQEGGGQGTCI